MDLSQNKRFRYENSHDRDIYINNLEKVIQSNIKLVEGPQDDISIYEGLKDIRNIYTSRTVFCKTTCSKLDLIKFLDKIGDFESIQIKDEYEISFKCTQDADLCAISSTSLFEFRKSTIFTPFNILRDLCIRRNISVDGCINQNMPPDYYRIIIGPLYDINFKRALNDISPLFGVKKFNEYHAVMFKDQNITKRIVDVLSRIRIKNNDRFSVRYAYKDCLITDIPEIFNIPFVSSLEETRVIFLLNYDIDKEFLCKLVGTALVDLKYTDHKIYIKCTDLDSSRRVYNLLGGMKYNSQILISGYYPEFNYEIGDI